MKKIYLFPLLALLSSFSIKAQSEFSYTSNYIDDMYINDAIESNNKYIFVGWKDSTSVQFPFLFALDLQGNLMEEYLLPYEGYYNNIFRYQEFYILGTTQFFSPGFHLSYALPLDSNYAINPPFNMATFDGDIHQSSLINDSIFAVVGVEYEATINTYMAFASVQNLKDSNSLITNYTSYSLNPLQSYDIIKRSEGYSVFLNNANSANPDEVVMLKLDDSLNVLDTTLLRTSYNQFINEPAFEGPVSAEWVSDTSFLLNGNVQHPTYSGESKNLDIALMLMDTSNAELQLNFVGKVDSNTYSSTNSISSNGEYLFIGNTENFDPTSSNMQSEFMLTKAALNGKPLWTKYYSNNTHIQLTKVLATSDGGALMVGTSYDQLNAISDVYILKVDSMGRSQAVGVEEIQTRYKTILYPNPSSSEINFLLDVESIQNGKLEIFTVNGQLVKSSELNSKSLDISFLERGLYFYRITSSDKIFTGRFVVRH